MTAAQTRPVPQPAPRSGQVPGASIGLLVLAALFYAPLLGILLDAEPTAGGGGEARMSAAFAELFAYVFGFAVWVTVGGLWLVAALHGAMPRWARAPAAVLYGLGGIAGAIAIDGAIELAGWVFLVPALLPPVVALYALWALIPGLHRALPPQATTITVFAAIGALIVATPALDLLDQALLPGRIARQQAEVEVRIAEAAAEGARLERAREERFQRLSPDSSLWDYIDPVEEPPGADGHERVLRGARQVKSRQQDAIALLQQRGVHWLNDLWQLDIAATPELCEAFSGAFAKEVSAPKYDLNLVDDIERQIPNLKWLGTSLCRPDAGLATAEAVLQRVVANNRNDPRWQDLLDLLSGLRRP